MKKYIKHLIFSALAIGFFSCDDGDEQVDTLLDTVERGAILRTVQVFSNEFPIGQTDAAFSIEIEEQDQEDGALLESVDIFLTYEDGSADDGDSSGGITDEVFFGNIPASDFTTGEFGLPRTMLTITFSEMLALVNLTDDQTFGGDTFRTRLVLNLTDGRSFTNSDVNGNVASGSFFLSPFQYTTPVVCPVGETEFIGDYTLENITAVDFGNLYAEGQTVTLSQPGEISVERQFSAVVLEDLGIGQDPDPFTFQLVCVVVVPDENQGTGLACGGNLDIGPPIGDISGMYITGDDSVFEIVIGYNESGAATCAVGSDAVIRLTRQ